MDWSGDPPMFTQMLLKTGQQRNSASIVKTLCGLLLLGEEQSQCILCNKLFYIDHAKQQDTSRVYLEFCSTSLDTLLKEWWAWFSCIIPLCPTWHIFRYLTTLQSSSFQFESMVINSSQCVLLFLQFLQWTLLWTVKWLNAIEIFATVKLWKWSVRFAIEKVALHVKFFISCVFIRWKVKLTNCKVDKW